MFGGLGIWEILLIFFILLLFFGAKRLPEIGKSLGEGIREFKDSVKEVGAEDSDRPELTGGPSDAPEEGSRRSREGGPRGSRGGS